MRIMFASKDRDLLNGYRILLSSDGTIVDTAFDGIQVLTALAEGKYDLLIVSQDIPRISCRQIVAQANEANLPVIVLTQAKAGLNILLDGVLANDYLEMPFAPEDLKSEIDSVFDKLKSGERIDYGGLNVEMSRFVMGNLRVTAKELDVLAALKEEGDIPAEKDRVFINALNGKLSKQGLRQRIRYEKNRFRLVTENE